MSRYDGLIIPRSYSEYINKTDAATLQQALQLSGVLSGAVAAGDNKAVKSSAVNNALAVCQKQYYIETMCYKNYGYNNGLTHYFKISCASGRSGFLISTGWNGNVWFENNGESPYRLSSEAYGVLGYAWDNNNQDLWIKTGGYGYISVLIPSLSKELANGVITFSDWTVVAPSGITFSTEVKKISYT